MEEELISFETAKLAKEKGFVEECLHFYCKNNTCNYLITPYKYSFEVNANQKSNDNFGYGLTWSAPTQSLLQKWLREEHNLFIEIFLTSKGNYTINNIVIIGKSEYDVDFKLFDKYEDALEEGLQHTLKLI